MIHQGRGSGDPQFIDKLEKKMTYTHIIYVTGGGKLYSSLECLRMWTCKTPA